MNLENKVFFKKNNNYSITICPKDKYQYYSKQNRLSKFNNLINELVISYHTNNIDYLLYTELSEPRSKSVNGPRLHIHGTLRFRTNRSIKWFLLYGYYNLTRIGIIDFDTIADTLAWLQYCKKQQHIIKTYPITNYSVDQNILKLPWEATEENNKN